MKAIFIRLSENVAVHVKFVVFNINSADDHSLKFNQHIWGTVPGEFHVLISPNTVRGQTCGRSILNGGILVSLHNSQVNSAKKKN